MKISEIETIRMKLNIPSRMTAGSIKNHGEDLTLDLIKLAEVQFESEKANGRAIKSGGTIFRKCIDSQAKQAKSKAMANAKLQQVQEWRDTRDREYEAGFRPTPEKLKQMLEELYLTGEIFEQEYEWGVKYADYTLSLIPEPQAELGI